MQWLDKLKEKVVEAKRLAYEEDNTIAALWATAELGSSVPQLLAYIEKLHKAINYIMDQIKTGNVMEKAVCGYTRCPDPQISCADCWIKWAEEAINSES